MKWAYDTLDFCFGEQPPIPSLGELIIYNFKKHFFVHINRGVIRGSKGGVNCWYTGVGAKQNEGGYVRVSLQEVGVLESEGPLPCDWGCHNSRVLSGPLYPKLSMCFEGAWLTQLV